MRTVTFIAICFFIPIFTFSQGSCNPGANSPLINYFLAALDNADTAKMDQYFNSGISINSTYCGGTTAYSGYFKTKSGQFRTSGDGFQKPFLMKAIENKNPFVVKYLIRKGANVNQSCSIPVTKYDANAGYPGSPNQWVGYVPLTIFPLNIAINKDFCRSSPSMEIIKILLDKGADPTVATWDAQVTNNLDLMSLLADKGAQFTYSSKDLLAAINENNTRAFNFYINSGVQPDCECFIAAAKRGDINKLDLFLDKGCKINCYNAFSFLSRQEGVDKFCQLTALGWAVANGDLNTVKFLVDNGADLNARCIWHGGMLDPNGKNQSLAEFSDAKYRDGRKNPAVTEYLLLAPGVQKMKMEENQVKILKSRSEAEGFLKDGKITEAADCFSKAYALSRDLKDKNGMAIYFRTKGLYLFNTAKKFDSAAYNFNEAFKQSNSSFDKYYYAASFYELGKYAEGIQICNELLTKKDIGKENAYRVLGLCNEKLGKTDEAKQYYRTGLELTPEKNYVMKVCLYSLLNEIEQSLANLKLAFENGFKAFDSLDNLSDLDNLKKSEKYIKLVTKYRKKSAN